MDRLTKKKTEGNIYTPLRGTIEDIIRKTPDVNLYRVRVPGNIDYSPGQFFMVSVWGAGEVPISVASHRKHSPFLDLCIRRSGSVTSTIHTLRAGDELWIRGPYGNGFPLDIVNGQDVIIVAGGIGIAPLRPLLFEFSDRERYPGTVRMIYGSRTPEDVVFLDEAEQYRDMGVELILTVDSKMDGWGADVGFVTDFLVRIPVDRESSVAYICGPELMMKNTTRDLHLMGMRPANIITTLEAHMKCGVGKCGHCYSGCRYICTDGPVFDYQTIKDFRMFDHV